MTKEKQLVSALLKRYFDSSVLALHKIPLGLRNTSYYIKTYKNTEFVMKIYAHGYRSQERIEEACEIVEKLRTLGRPVLEMIRGKDGLYTQTITDTDGTHIVTLSKYVESHFSETNVNKKLIVNIAKELKLLHSTLHSLPHSDIYRLPEVRENIEIGLQGSTIRNIKKYFSKDHGKHREKMNDFIIFYKQQGEKLLEEYKKQDLQSLHLNHGDFNLNNFHVKNNKIFQIFDFDEMLLAPHTFEIALTLYYLDYAEEFYIDELIEIFLVAYYGKHKVKIKIIKEVIYFMKYRAFHRMARYFNHFQFTPRPGGHFTKFARILTNFNEIDAKKIYEHIQK